MKRRIFIRNSALGAMALTIPAIRSFGNNFSADYKIPKRVLGKTGEKLSVIGFGGIMLNDNSQDFANEIVAKAYELGVNYFDVAPNYGNAQEKLGPALKPYRNNCFLACKTHERTAEGAQKTLEDSRVFVAAWAGNLVAPRDRFELPTRWLTATCSAS